MKTVKKSSTYYGTSPLGCIVWLDKIFGLKLYENNWIIFKDKNQVDKSHVQRLCIEIGEK